MAARARGGSEPKMRRVPAKRGRVTAAGGRVTARASRCSARVDPGRPEESRLLRDDAPRSVFSTASVSGSFGTLTNTVGGPAGRGRATRIGVASSPTEEGLGGNSERRERSSLPRGPISCAGAGAACVRTSAPRSTCAAVFEETTGVGRTGAGGLKRRASPRRRCLVVVGRVGEAASSRVGETASRRVGEAPSLRVGETASRRVGEAPSLLVGETASRRVGEAASSRVGATAARRVGEPADRRVGGAPSLRVGEVASWRVGETASRRVGETAKRRVGETASRRDGSIPVDAAAPSARLVRTDVSAPLRVSSRTSLSEGARRKVRGAKPRGRTGVVRGVSRVRMTGVRPPSPAGSSHGRSRRHAAGDGDCAVFACAGERFTARGSETKPGIRGANGFGSRSSVGRRAMRVPSSVSTTVKPSRARNQIKLVLCRHSARPDEVHDAPMPRQSTALLHRADTSQWLRRSMGRGHWSSSFISASVMH